MISGIIQFYNDLGDGGNSVATLCIDHIVYLLQWGRLFPISGYGGC